MVSWVLVSAIITGGGSMLLFGVFLFFGPLRLIHMGWSEPATLAWDGLLSLVFFVQHSSMLRRGFRQRLARIIPPHYHGALYAISSGFALTAVVIFWQSSSIGLYALEGVPRWLVRGLFCLAMAGMAWGARALQSFDPMGLSAFRAHVRGKQSPPQHLVIRGPYWWVRHPLYLFSILLIWACPDVTADRLLFNVLWTAWIYVGSILEEADLVAEFGETYRDYRRRVPRLVPWRVPPGS
jgi:protein-S-isoprenylcysteine O-methyltransferase Ste14